MVLGGDKATVGADHAHGLVVAAVTIFQFIDACSGSFGEQLVAHADAHAGTHVFVLQELSDVSNRLGAGVGVAGTVGEEETVELKGVEVIVPRNTNDLHATFEQTANDVVLHAAIDKHHALASFATAIANHFFAGNAGDIVHSFILCRRNAVGLIVKDNLAHHHAVLTQHLGQFAGVDAGDAVDFFALEPIGETFHCIPVAVLLTVVTDDDGGGIDFVTLHEVSQTFGGHAEGGHPVVSDQGIGQSHQLPGVGWVGETFRIAGHGGVEHHLSCHRGFITKRLAGEPDAVVKD